jgi:hypothetical protein
MCEAGKLNTRAEGLTDSEAATRLAEYGPNVLAKDQRAGFGNPSILNQRQSINPPIKSVPHPPTSLPGHLSLSHSIRIKSAGLWLILGEADEAVS